MFLFYNKRKRYIPVTTFLFCTFLCLGSAFANDEALKTSNAMPEQSPFEMSFPSLIDAEMQTPMENVKQVWHGVSRPSYDAQLSFAGSGAVLAIYVERGSEVTEGQLLMEQDTRAEDQRLQLLAAEMKNTIKVRVLETQKEQARLDMRRFQNALKNNAATNMEVQHAELQYKLAILGLEEERFRLKQIGVNRKELLAQREKMRLYAACNGTVEDISVERGMAVDRNLVAVHLVAIDPMIVDLNLPVDTANTLHIGDKFSVTLSDGTETIGEVVQKASIAVLSSRTLRVRLRVPNPEHKPVGLMVTVKPVD